MHFRGHYAFTFVTARSLAHHPKDGFVSRLQVIDLSPPCYSSYEASGSCLGGFGPTERANLCWTHIRTCRFLRRHRQAPSRGHQEGAAKGLSRGPSSDRGKAIWDRGLACSIQGPSASLNPFRQSVELSDSERLPCSCRGRCPKRAVSTSTLRLLVVTPLSAPVSGLVSASVSASRPLDAAHAAS